MHHMPNVRHSRCQVHTPYEQVVFPCPQGSCTLMEKFSLKKLRKKCRRKVQKQHLTNSMDFEIRLDSNFLPLTSCLALAKVVNLSEPHLFNGNDNSTYII